MVSIFPLSSTPEQIERLESLVDKGKRSRFVWDAINEKLDRIENKKKKEVWIKERVVPEVDKILEGYDWGMLRNMHSTPEKRRVVIKRLSELSIEVSDGELQYAIGVLMNEDGRS